MTATWDALVVGAGPAGAAAATVLARAGARVLLCERGTLPRHRLCGEFVSGEAAEDLHHLGLDLADTPALRIEAACVHSGAARAGGRLEPTGWSLSRHFLDAWLARHAAASGAVLATRTRVGEIHGDPARGYAAELDGERSGPVRARVVIAATGKRDGFASGASQPPGPKSWVGLKMHLLAGTDFPARVELHAFDGGYVGTCPVGDGRVNVCAVARRDTLARHGTRGGGAGALRALLAAGLEPGPHLAAQPHDADSVRAESGMDFGTSRAAPSHVLCAGDAAAMPHPLVGDGIAMALRSGRIAAAHAMLFLHGDLDAAGLIPAYSRAWSAEFCSRLRWARALHALLEHPSLAGPALSVLGRWPHAFEYLVKRSRGRPLAGDPALHPLPAPAGRARV
jgi:flavin-dependent dehydrogenase